MERFADKVILISGATGGIGEAAAMALSAAGARLALTDLDEGGLQALSARLPGESVSTSGDISNPATAQAWIAKAVEAFGRVDAAFNNAGVEHRLAWLAEMEPQTSRRVLEINVLGVQFAMQTQLAQFLAQAKSGRSGGAILNTASVAGVSGAPKLGTYAASKHAVVGLSRTAAIEYARFGIRVNTLCPAFIKTRMVMDGIVKDYANPEDGFAKLASGIPMGRIGEVAETVPAILFGLDPANSFFTGQELILDGGMTA
ncbi:MAG: SDR family oxidoreductase [Pseudomonadota bacterium]